MSELPASVYQFLEMLGDRAIKWNDIPVELHDAWRIARNRGLIDTEARLWERLWGWSVERHESNLESLNPAYWINDRGRDALALYHATKAASEKPSEGGEALPAEGFKYDKEEDVPAEFREGGKPDGALLTVDYLAEFTGSDISKAKKKRTITTHVKVGRAYVYLFKEIEALRTIRVENDSRRDKQKPEPSATAKAAVARRKEEIDRQKGRPVLGI